MTLPRRAALSVSVTSRMAGLLRHRISIATIDYTHARIIVQKLYHAGAMFHGLCLFGFDRTVSAPGSARVSRGGLRYPHPETDRCVTLPWSYVAVQYTAFRGCLLWTKRCCGKNVWHTLPVHWPHTSARRVCNHWYSGSVAPGSSGMVLMPLAWWVGTVVPG